MNKQTNNQTKTNMNKQTNRDNYHNNRDNNYNNRERGDRPFHSDRRSSEPHIRKEFSRESKKKKKMILIFIHFCLFLFIFVLFCFLDATLPSEQNRSSQT